MPTTQNIVIDLNTRGATPVAFTHQGDTARTFVFEVYNNGEEFDVSSYSVKVAALLPADNGYYVIAGENMATGDTYGNTITVTLPAEYTQKFGNGVLTLVLTGSGATIRPINIDLRIQKSADAPETIAGASDFIPILQRYMAEDMQTYINAWLDAHPEAMQYYISGSKLVLDSNGILSIENDTDDIIEALDLDTLRSEVSDLKSDLSDFKEEANEILKYENKTTNTGDGSVLVNVQYPVTSLSMKATSGTLGLYDGMLILNGIENWSLHSSGRFYASDLGASFSVGDYHVASYMYCLNTTSTENTQKFFWFGSSGVYINKNTDYETVDELKAYLTAHPLIIWYRSSNYNSATQFYQCVSVFTGSIPSTNTFVCTYGTDQKFNAIRTTDSIDFISGAIKDSNGTTIGTFTPIVFTQHNTVTIVGGGTITVVQSEVLGTLKSAVTELKDEIESNTSERNAPVIDATAKNQVPFIRLANIIRGGLMCEDITNNEIICLNRSGYKSHDGTIVKSGNMLYCVYCSYADGSTGGDAASNETAVVRLDGVSVSTGERTIELIVAEKTGTYGGVEQTGGAGSPNAYLVGNIIHILYTAKMGTTYVEMHCTYDIASGTLGNYSPVSVGGANLNVAWINSKYGYNFSDGAYLSAQSNSTIATDGNGTYYIGWVWSYSTASSITHAIIFSTTDFANWTIFKEIEYQTFPIYELALSYASDYLIFYFRPSMAGRNNVNNFGDDSMYGILGKIDISTSEVVQIAKLQNCGSRPAFFNYDEGTYLFTNTYNRDNFAIVMINTDRIYQSTIYSEGYGGYNYPSFFVDGEIIYVLHSGHDMQVSRYTPRSYGNAEIRDALLSIVGA